MRRTASRSAARICTSFYFSFTTLNLNPRGSPKIFQRSAEDHNDLPLISPSVQYLNGNIGLPGK